MITIKSDGRLVIPEEDVLIGYAGDNLNATKEFFVEGRTDLSLAYRMYLIFDDGTSNFFLLSKSIQLGGTKLVWNVTNDQIYKSGIVKMQIKASNTSGLVFHTKMTSLLVQRSIEFAEVYSEKVNSEFLQHEQNLNNMIAACAELNETAQSTLDAIRNEKPFSSADLRDGCITRAKLDSNLGALADDFAQNDYTKVVDMGEVSAVNAFDSSAYVLPNTKYLFTAMNPLAQRFQIREGESFELTYSGGYQIATRVNENMKYVRKINRVAPSFDADSWQPLTAVIPAEKITWTHLNSSVKNRITGLENTVGTLNTELENTLNGV